VSVSDRRSQVRASGSDRKMPVYRGRVYLANTEAQTTGAAAAEHRGSQQRPVSQTERCLVRGLRSAERGWAGGFWLGPEIDPFREYGLRQIHQIEDRRGVDAQHVSILADTAAGLVGELG
jgi:hypothetical protein